MGIDLNIDKKKQDYVFASSRVRSVARYLMTKEMANAMIESRTPEDAMKIVYEMAYGGGEEISDVRDFELVLEKELEDTFALVQSVAPDKDELSPLFYPYDYHNIKVLLKAEFLGGDYSQYLMNIGSMDIKLMQEGLRERNFVLFTDTKRKAILEVIDVFARTKDPQLLDILLDKACFREMLEKAELIGNQFLIDYVKLYIDISNIKTFIRVREMGKPWDFFHHAYVEGGRIDDKIFISGYDETYSNVGEKLVPYGFEKILIDGGQALRETGRFTVFERICENMVMDHAKKAKHITFGLEPLLAHLLAKEIEIRTVRIIMTGLFQGLSKEAIKERVRDTYV